ncbi:DNA ligase 3 [Diabrotica virgifera virgifera]|uniref:DNA ligase n=1 Tax=Diabrotica virgifera virgifera TaxID=50390 RepID=A0A6P7FPU5_DIAVI|nr:DNA ligase 3 [Diabrotica virgifera virgifera]
MSYEDDQVEEKPFAIERAKQGRAVCKKCKKHCLQGEWRIAKLVANPFGDGKMKAWHHINCLFEQFLKQRKTTKRIEGPEEIDGWDALDQDLQNNILKQIEECDTFHGKAPTTPSKKKKPPASPMKPSTADSNKEKDKHVKNEVVSDKNELFKDFRKLIADIANHDSHLDKTSCIKKVFSEKFPDSSFKDQIILWSRLLLPGVVQRVYNLKSKQLIKLFSRIFVTDQSEMLEHLELGDIGETIHKFFEESTKVKPNKKSKLTVKEVDVFLNKLSTLTKEDDQIEHFKSLIPKCTSNDLKTIIRLIKGDLRMGAGAKTVLDAVHADAYQSYQTSRDLTLVINEFMSSGKKHKADVVLMTPVLPMLAEACKSVEQAINKCPNGMYSEIKYDGERVQVHKQGSTFKYFSRSLKPVLAHKIAHFKEYIPKAFPNANDLILDSEILMMDTVTGNPLPFGTLGVHKQTEFKDATVCLFVFDCIYFNGRSLIKKPLSERKKFLQDNMTEIPNRIMFSEMQEIRNKSELAKMIARVLKQGLEGLVLKDLQSIYEPGKRHWLKVKKDYLFGGAMADSADLIVLGAWYGTGKKGGMMSVFLMGCYNPDTDSYCTVTKVHTGHDDKTLEKLQNELDMIKISQDQSKLPKWLKCTKTMIPDFVARDPKKQPVWEITGAEFSKNVVHTANGISIRFPRVTKIRDDKDVQTATDLHELVKLYNASAENIDVSLLTKDLDSSQNDKPAKSPQKRKNTDSPETSPSKKQKTIEKKEKSSKQEKIPKQESSSAKKANKSKTAIFKGVKALLEDEMKKDDHADIVKHFIDHGGDILLDEEEEVATHVLHYYNLIREPLVVCPYTARHVTFEWIEDSISAGSLCDYRMYTVRWNPDG